MTQFLPPNLLTLFAARDPIPYKPPVAKLSHEKPTDGYSGVSQYLKFFEDPKDTPLPTKYETRDERLDRKRKEKQELVAYKLEQEIANWNPNSMEKSTTDPFKTLFIGRINYDTSESKLRREFESFGTVKKIYVIQSKKSGKPRGYAFVEYESERDMRSAYKHADGKKIDGKRVLVDVERGRTVKGWLPRRLGGGLGGTRRGGPDVNVKISGREDSDRDRFREDERPERRERDRSRGEKRRERDRSRDKERVDRRGRDRSRDRVERVDRRGRDRSRDKERDRRDRSKEEKSKPDKKDRDHSDRKRKHRSKSRDKNDKERKRERKEKDKEREKIKVKTEDFKVKIKEEPADDYPTYNSYGPYDDDDGPYDDSYVKKEKVDGENGESEV